MPTPKAAKTMWNASDTAKEALAAARLSTPTHSRFDPTVLRIKTLYIDHTAKILPGSDTL
jgi:hypothetical protein